MFVLITGNACHHCVSLRKHVTPTGSRKKPGCTCNRAFLCPPSLSSLKRRQGTKMPENCAAVPGFMLGHKTPRQGSQRNPCRAAFHSTSFTSQSGFSFDIDGTIKATSKRCHFGMSMSVVTIAASCVPPSKLSSSFSSCPCFHGMQQACRWIPIGARRGYWLGEDSRFWWGGSRLN